MDRRRHILVNYTGPYLNDRPPHVQVGQDPDVFVGQVACLANCRAATSKAIEWDVLGVWNNALDAPAHMTAYYGPDAAGQVATYCAGSSSGGGGKVVCPAGQYFRKWGPACGADCCECVANSFCPGDEDGYQYLYPCPAGTCSPAGASAEDQCTFAACPPLAS